MADPAAAPLSFRVELVYPSLEGFDGILVIGPVLDEGAGLKVGDKVGLPTDQGTITAICTGFPLIRMEPHQVDWLRVTLTGIDAADVVVGSVGYAVSE